ncbi:hypothetical protein Ahy_B03g066321 [Arachis hypogaea]|uniref:Uncharacterized protein n=1 Tax=Arachis hypogaea TaxID=3818 RepID=A0A445A3Z2_ARAHY|nr:hypothetical protein Ahy_B03g066321 [Arachis hypogaea]
MMEDIHERFDHFTICLCPDIKKELYVHWETNEGFRHRHLSNRDNRASTRSSKYTDGSATFMKTKAVVDLDMVWCETASKLYKNRVYGMGLFFADNLYTSSLRPSSAFATSWPIKPEDGVDLSEQVLELTRRLHQ